MTDEAAWFLTNTVAVSSVIRASLLLRFWPPTTSGARIQGPVQNGQYCYPLTVSDSYSRFLLGCQALRSTSVADAKLVFLRSFQEFGLPKRIRTDNGVPFATNTLEQLSQL